LSCSAKVIGKSSISSDIPGFPPVREGRPLKKGSKRFQKNVVAGFIPPERLFAPLISDQLAQRLSETGSRILAGINPATTAVAP